jgi:hypothetical protein
MTCAKAIMLGAGVALITFAETLAAPLCTLSYEASIIQVVLRGPTLPPTPDARTESEHDCDRILYSDELRRLGGVTQASG